MLAGSGSHRSNAEFTILIRGDFEHAQALWAAAGDPRGVDAIIGKMAEANAKKVPEPFDEAVALVNLIEAPAIKAPSLANLSSYG